MNKTTNIEFHKKMRRISTGYFWENSLAEDFNHAKEYYKEIKGLTQEEIFKKFKPEHPKTASHEHEYEYIQKEGKKYIKAIAQINYDLAKQISGRDDLIIEDTNNQKITIPFYFEELHDPINYEIKGNEIEFKKGQELKISKINGEYYQQHKEIIYVGKIQDSKVVSYEEEERLLDMDIENLKQYYVHYELYSSYFVDPGGMDTIWATSEEEAVKIAQSLHDSYEDGEVYSYSVSGNDYGNTNNSYENVIEKPAIEKAAMKIEKKMNRKEEKYLINEEWDKLVRQAEEIVSMINCDLYYQDLLDMILQAKTLKEFLDEFLVRACERNENTMNKIFKAYAADENSIDLIGFYEKIQVFDEAMEEKKAKEAKERKNNKTKGWDEQMPF